MDTGAWWAAVHRAAESPTLSTRGRGLQSRGSRVPSARFRLGRYQGRAGGLPLELVALTGTLGSKGVRVLRRVLCPACAHSFSQMKMLDSENARLGRELLELQGRLALGERAEKEGRREALGLRQKLLRGEASLEALRQEVTRQLAGGLDGRTLGAVRRSGGLR